MKEVAFRWNDLGRKLKFIITNSFNFSGFEWFFDGFEIITPISSCGGFQMTPNWNYWNHSPKFLLKSNPWIPILTQEKRVFGSRKINPWLWVHKCTHSITVKCENVQSNASQISSVRPNVHRELDSWMQHENNISGLACFSSTIYCNNARRWCIFSSWHSNIVYQKTIEEIMMWFSRHNRSVTQLKKKEQFANYDTKIYSSWD